MGTLGSCPQGRSADDAGVTWNRERPQWSGSARSGTEGVPWWNGARAYLNAVGEGCVFGRVQRLITLGGMS